MAKTVSKKTSTLALIQSQEKLHNVLACAVVAISLITFFVLGLYERLLRLLEYGWFLAAYDPYIRYYLAKFLVDDGIARGLLWWISGGLSKYVTKHVVELFRIQISNGHTYFTQFWYPYYVNWATVLSPGTSLFGALFYVLFRNLFHSVYKASIVCPCVFNALSVFSIAYLAWRLCHSPEVRKWCAIMAAAWAGLSILFIQRSLSGWFDDVAFFQFFAPLGLALFLESYYRKGPLRVVFLTLSALVNGLTVWIWGAYVYLWNIYGLLAIVVALYVIIRDRADIVSPSKFFISYLATYIGFVLFILMTPRYSTHVLASGISIVPHLGLIASLITFLSYSLFRKYLPVIRKSVLVASGVIACVLIVCFALTVTGVLPVKVFKIGGRLLAIVVPVVRSPLVQSVAEHSYVSPGYVYAMTRLGVIAAALSVTVAFVQPSLATIMLAVTTVFAAYFTSSMTYVLMLAAIVLVPAFVCSIDVFHRFRTRAVAMTLVCLVCVLVGASAVLTASMGATASKTTYPTILPGGLADWIYSLEWLKYKTSLNATVLSWWDYGYLTTVIGNRTSLADNSTINTTQIATIAKFFLTNVSNVRRIYELLQDLGLPKYVLVYGPYTVVPYSPTPFMRYCVGLPLPLGDFPKSYWMARIAGYKDDFIYTHFLCVYTLRKIRIGTVTYVQRIPNVIRFGKFEREIVVPWSLNYTLYNMLFSPLVIFNSPQCAGIPVWVFEKITLLIPSGKVYKLEEKVPFYEGHLVNPVPLPRWLKLVYEPYGKDVAGWVMIYEINYTALRQELANITKT